MVFKISLRDPSSSSSFAFKRALVCVLSQFCVFLPQHIRLPLHVFVGPGSSMAYLFRLARLGLWLGGTVGYQQRGKKGSWSSLVRQHWRQYISYRPKTVKSDSVFARAQQWGRWTLRLLHASLITSSIWSRWSHDTPQPENLRSTHLTDTDILEHGGGGKLIHTRIPE